jgi:hypothetical protein
MIEVSHYLFVGNQNDCKGLEGQDFAVVHACKYPYHRSFVGYAKQLPKDHKEYLWAIRGKEIALNIIDADNKEYFAESMINTALTFIERHLGFGMKVLVHCNLGGSRSPSIAMLYMRDELPDNFEEAEEQFRLLYPPYNPKNGIREYVKNHW